MVLNQWTWEFDELDISPTFALMPFKSLKHLRSSCSSGLLVDYSNFIADSPPSLSTDSPPPSTSPPFFFLCFSVVLLMQMIKI